MSTVVSPDHQYQFDSIIVTPQNQLPKHLHGESSLLFHDKKKIYAGSNANWTLKLKDLTKVEVSTRDVYDDTTVNRGRSRSIGRGGGGSSSRGGHSETLTLALVGKKMQIVCTTTTGNRTALAAKQLESFIEGLKNVHRKVKVKEGDKDPYAFEDESNKRKNFANTTRVRSSSLGRSKKAYGHRGSTSGSTSRVKQVTPHTTTSAVYMSPSKKRSTSGAFQSPARNRSISFGDAKHQKQQQQYAHFQPETNTHNNDTTEATRRSTNEELSYVSGNVVHEPESPAVRKLNLAPKSPRNATPTKLRSILSDEVGSSRGRTPLVANQLNGISGGNIRLRKKITFDLDVRSGGSSNDDIELEEERVVLKEKEGDKKKQMELEDSEGEDEVVPKRRRLKKISSGTTKDEDSDVEFDTLGGDDDRVEATPASSCKKKLRLSSGDEDEDEVEEGDANMASSEKEGSVAGEAESSSVSSAPSSPTKKSNADATNKKESTSTKSTPKTSVADAALAPSPAKSKKGSIHNFFAPKQSSNKPASAKPKEAKRSSPPDTYGAIMSTPSKKARSEGTSPSTPPRRTNCSKPTPVSKMTQRKNASSYFDSVGNVNKGLAEDNIGGDTLKYSSEEEDIVPGYRDEYYDKDDNENNKEEGEEDEENGHAGEQTAHEKMGGRRGMYGRAGRGPRGWSGPLGQSRLASRGSQSRIQQRKMESRMSPNRGKLDFSGFKAGTRFSPKVASTADRALGRKDSWENLPPLVPINEADKTFKPAASTPSIPGVQNLGNTCYLSASLQTLFSIPDFISDLYKTYATFATTTPGKKMPLTQALLEVAVVIGVVKNEDAPLISPDVAKGKSINNKAAYVAAEPVQLKKQMDVLTNKFAGFEQRDAHEFLSDLIDFLHDELAASPSAGADSQTNALAIDGSSGEDGKAASEDENKNPNQSPVKTGEEKEAGKSNAPDTIASNENVVLPTDEYFRLNVRVCLECDSCGYSRSKDEMYRHLSVDVGEDTELEKWSVERSLQQFFQPEKRELKCEKCDSGRTATQTMNITSCPKALLLHFKRFIVTQEMKGAIGSGNSNGKENNSAPPPRMEMVLKKNNAKIRLEESLSINPFVGKDEESPSEKYHLRGVVHHLGTTAFSGHYTACAKKLLAKQNSNETKSDPANNPPDNEEQWVFFDDRVGVKKDTEYVTGSDRNQRNCYMALYELK